MRTTGYHDEKCEQKNNIKFLVCDCLKRFKEENPLWEMKGNVIYPVTNESK